MNQRDVERVISRVFRFVIFDILQKNAKLDPQNSVNNKHLTVEMKVVITHNISL